MDKTGRSNLLFLHSVIEGRAHDSSVFSPNFTIGSDNIHSPAPENLSPFYERSHNEKTYNNARWLAAGLMKLFLMPPPEICRATSRLEEYKVGSPVKKGTKDTVSFLYFL